MDKTTNSKALQELEKIQSAITAYQQDGVEMS
jgi:hypothetical protein